MKIFKSNDSRGAVSIRSVAAIAAVCLVPVLLLATGPAYPGWWTGRGAVVVSGTAHDYTAANQGQLKAMATSAFDELSANLPGGVGDMTVPNGTGYKLTALINSWSTITSGTRVAVSGTNTNDYAAVNLGQVKNVATLFYNRLIEVGYSGHYPWTTSTTPANDYAIANTGQVKNLFNFDVTYKTDSSNPLPDWWQMAFFGHLGVDPSADPDGDGLTNLQEFQNGTSPVKVDTNGDGIPDGVEIADGLNPLGSNASSQVDANGLSVLAEYLQGSGPNPNAPTTALVIYSPLE